MVGIHISGTDAYSVYGDVAGTAAALMSRMRWCGSTSERLIEVIGNRNALYNILTSTTVARVKRLAASMHDSVSVCVCVCLSA